MLAKGYKDPSKEILENGRSVADVIRGKGLKGVIVSPSRGDGRSIDYDPHDKNNIDINVVNPDGSNIHSLHLAQFTKEAVRSAVDAAKNKIPGSTIEDIRERAAMVFEELAAFSGSGVVKKQSSNAPVPPPVPKIAPGSVSSPVHAPADVDRAYSPMAAFGLKRPSAASSSPTPKNAISPQIGPPSKLVYFEKEGIGTVPAFFHDVITEIFQDGTGNGFIVLVYDLNFEQSAARWFPPSEDPYKRPWAVQLQNETRLYLVHTTGFQFVYENREFCVLLVEKSVVAEE
jgi:hypothetical protein